MKSRKRYLLLFSSVLLVIFIAFRIWQMSGDSIELISTGRMVSGYSCGERTSLSFFSFDDRYPIRMTSVEGPSFPECLQAVFFLRSIQERLPQITVGYFDVEPDGVWDFKAEFGGEWPRFSPGISEFPFKYFVRDSNGNWIEEQPPKGMETLSEIMGNS